MNPLDALQRGRQFRTQLQDRRRRLYRTAYSWCLDAVLAEDLAQEALTKAYKGLPQLRCLEAMDAWIFDILANCWRDHLRRRRITEDIDDFAESSELSCDGTEEQTEAIARVRAAIARLPLGQREVLSLVDLEGFSYDEAAKILKIPSGTVTSRIVRAREALRRALVEYGSERKPTVIPWRRLR